MHARSALLALGACLAAACVSVPPPALEPPAQEQAMESWARVLECCVDEAGRIDFAGLSAQPADLERYVAYLARFDAAALPSAEARLAHAINAYNAMAMYAVIRAGIPRTNAGLRKIRFFYLRRYSIDGVRQSLYAYEKRIREVGDPRVHFALNCMSVSCPRLPRQPFSAETLDAELEREARRFFADLEGGEPRRLHQSLRPGARSARLRGRVHPLRLDDQPRGALRGQAATHQALGSTCSLSARWAMRVTSTVTASVAARPTIQPTQRARLGPLPATAFAASPPTWPRYT